MYFERPKERNIDTHSIIVGQFNNLSLSVDRSFQQKIKKETGLKWHFRSD